MLRLSQTVRVWLRETSSKSFGHMKCGVIDASCP